VGRGGEVGVALCVLLVNTAYFGEVGWSGVGVTFALALPISVVQAGILVVHAHYVVADELSAMLRGGAGLPEPRRDLALRVVESREHHLCLRIGYGEKDRD